MPALVALVTPRPNMPPPVVGSPSTGTFDQSDQQKDNKKDKYKEKDKDTDKDNNKDNGNPGQIFHHQLWGALQQGWVKPAE